MSNILYGFQQEGVLFIEKKNGNALLADDMGLGKTLQAISYLYRNPKAAPVIIVCPSSVKENWKAEIKKWTKRDSLVLNGRAPKKLTKKIKYFIINYDILPYWIDAFIERGYKALIIDEGHYVKNMKTKRSKAVDVLNNNAKHTLILTGTPIENRPIEIYNLIRLIRPKLFPKYWDFAQRYCDAKRNGFGWDFTGSSNTQELHHLLTKTIMIRRLKKNVLKDLPPKQFAKVIMSIDNRKEYDEAEQNFIKYITGKIDKDISKLNSAIAETDIDPDLIEASKVSNIEVMRLKREKVAKVEIAPALIQLGALKQLAAQGKIKQTIDWIEDFLQSGKKLVIFGVHKRVIKQLHEPFKDISVVLDGSTTPNKRQRVVEKFQTDPECKLFIGNIKAAGIGITLTAASDLVVFEFPWSPSELEQAEDRVFRIGQENKVTIYHHVAVDTIEERIIDLIQNKKKVIDAVIDGKKTQQRNLLTELINSYKNRGTK